MDNEEKIKYISGLIGESHTEQQYYKLLEVMGDLKHNYRHYLSTEPIDCDKELERLNSADYELCTALLTMLLREDHFSNGSLQKRYEEGQVDVILEKMIELLE